MRDDCEPPFRVADDLRAIFELRNQQARVHICPECWGRGEIVPIMLRIEGTISFVLPDLTEVRRMAGSYLHCSRCAWSEQKGHMAEPREGQGPMGGEG